MLRKLQNFRLFRRAKSFETRREVILWWERRRIPYNLIVGVTGIVTTALLVLMAYFVETKYRLEAVFPDPPFAVLFLVFLYGVAANVCYTGGWVSELLAKKGWEQRAERYGEIVFMLGVLFSIALTLLPVVISFVIYSVEILLAKK